MKELWNWIKKYILCENCNLKCGNGLNEIYHNHPYRGIGNGSIRKTFYLKDWGGPIGEVKYYYECGQLETVEIWEKVNNWQFKMIEHTGYNRDGSLKNGMYQEYHSEFDLRGSIVNNRNIIYREKSFWGDWDEYVIKRLSAKTYYKDGVRQLDIDSPPGEDWVCKKCNEKIAGNFDTCWNCSTNEK